MNRTSTQPTNTPAQGAPKPLLRRLVTAAAGFLLLAACTSDKQDPVTSSQTHWLKSCDSSSDCGDLSCECGVCTLPCDDDDSCAGLGGDAVCARTEGLESCGTEAVTRVCLEGCTEDDDCGSGSSCEDDVCVPQSDSSETPPGVNCGDYELCDALDPCSDGTNCIAFSECGGALCIPFDEACELSCPDTNDCSLAESYPEQLFCDGKVPAKVGDGTDGTDVSTPADEPSGVECSDYEPCGLDDACDTGSCIDLGGCRTAICIDADEACELSCPADSECEYLDSYPMQIACEGFVPGMPGPAPSGEGIQCADHPVCDPMGDGCESGLECLIVPECGTDPSDEFGGAICIDTDEACELSCPDGECVILESYPAQLGCSGERVPATPAPGSDPATDAGVATGFSCGDYQECGTDIEEPCASDTICVTLPECGDDTAYGVCVPPDVACEFSCPDSACLQMESYPVQLACVECPPEACAEGTVLNESTCECEPTSSDPPGVSCDDYPTCSIENNTCPANSDCIAVDGCDSAICIPADEACDLSCPDPNECALAESFPLQIACPGIVPGTTATSSNELDLADLNSDCEDDTCPDGLTPVFYFGIAGEAGPEFCSCSIPCADDADVCPDGSSCQTIADGPGEVCVQE